MPLHDVSEASGAWKVFSPNAQGFSALTSNTGIYTVIGDTCIIIPQITGTSNANTFTWTAPYAAAATAFMVCLLTDNGSTVLGRAGLVAGSAVVTMGLSSGGTPVGMPGGGFTTSGTKGCNGNLAALFQIAA